MTEHLATRVARSYIFKANIQNFGKFLEGLGIKNDCSFMAIWNILWPFCTYILGAFGNLVVS
jgi:hypothetical protein